MRTLDLFIFLLYTLGIVGIGFYFHRKNKTTAAFTLGNQRIPTWVVSLSIFATFVSSISYLALPGNAYLGNWNAFVFSLSIPFALIFSLKFFVPLYRQMNSPSAYTYLEQRFGVWARVYASVCYLLTQLMRVGTILYLLALALHSMFGWDISLIIILTGIIVLLYSVLGGIQAVVWTDAIQGIILIGGAFLCLIYIFIALPGGMPQFWEIADKQDKFSLGSFGFELDQPTFWVVLVYGFFINMQNFGIDQNYVQRYMLTETDQAARRSVLSGGLLYIPVSAMFLLIGTALFAFYQSNTAALPGELGSDQVFPYFIVNELPPGLTGLIIAAIFAAGMSTISTSFNSTATVVLTDYYQRFKQSISESESLKVLYISSAIISVLGIGIALAMINVKSVLDTWWKLASVFSGGMLGLFLLGAFSQARNQFGAMVGVVCGILIIFGLSLADISPKIDTGLHGYLTIVLGTTVIFLVGFLIGIMMHSKSKP